MHVNWWHSHSFRMLIMAGMSNCLMDLGGSHILLDQVILLALISFSWEQRGNVHMHIHCFPSCRYNDCPNLTRLQILQNIPNNRWKCYRISSRGAETWTSPITFAYRRWYFKLGFILWFYFTRWGKFGGPAHSEWYWRRANNRKR